MTLRRDVLLTLLGGAIATSGGALAGCGAPAAQPRPPALPPLGTADLRALVPRPGLGALVYAKPRHIAQIPWLIPPIGKLVPEANFAAYQRKMGFDLRQVPEAVFADFGAQGRLYLVRHNARAPELEARFRERLSDDVVRSEDRPDLVRVSGRVGRSARSFARLGQDLVAYQQEGDTARGPLRVATLFAQDRLKTPRALLVPPLSDLLSRFGDVPLLSVALGPFSESWHRAARGLLEVATAIGAAVRPSARENLLVSVALTGAFGDRGSAAADTLRESYDDLASTSVGRLFGLHVPIERPVVAGTAEVVTLAVELSPTYLAEALVASLAPDVEALMRIERPAPKAPDPQGS